MNLENEAPSQGHAKLIFVFLPPFSINGRGNLVYIKDARHEFRFHGMMARHETLGLSRVPCRKNMQLNLEQL